MPTAIIVEDLPVAAEALQSALASHCPTVEILAWAPSVVQAAKLIREKKPELLFLDIELPDGTGFDLLDILGDWPGNVIFTTGLDDQALKAFRYAAVDYLLKPIDPDLLQAAVARVQPATKYTADQRELLQAVHSSTQGLPGRLALHSQDKVQLIHIADILRCESEGNYTHFYLQDKQHILVARTLKSYAELLEEHGFLRVHQSHLINPNFLREFVKVDGGYLVMTDGSKIPVSVRRRSMVMAFLGDV